jgi:hypothetical protein
MMWNRNNWLTYVAVLAVTVITLVCGQFLWNKYSIAKPLDKGLQQVQGVETVNWEDGKNSENVALNITLDKVDNLQKTYGEITDTAKQVLGRKAFRVVLHDHRTPELEKLYYNVQYNIQEAIFTGNFSTMASNVQKQAEGAQAGAKVYVDTGYVYVQLTKGPDALYAVIPRQSGNQEVK